MSPKESDLSSSETVSIRLQSDDGIPCPNAAIVVPSNIGRKQLQEVILECCTSSSEWLDLHATFAYDLFGVPVTESIKETIDECNATEQIVSIESELPIIVWLPMPPPDKSLHIPTPSIVTGVAMHDKVIYSCQIDGRVSVYSIKGKETATSVLKSPEGHPLSHRCITAWNGGYAVGSDLGRLHIMQGKNPRIECVGHSREVTALAIHQTCDHLASVDDGGLLKLWSTGNQEEPVESKGKKSKVEFAPRQSPLVTLDMASACRAVAWSDEHTVVVGGNSLQWVDTTMARVSSRRACPRAIQSMSLQGDRLLIACLDQHIRVYTGTDKSSAFHAGGTCRSVVWTPSIHEHSFAAIVDNEATTESYMTMWDVRYGDSAVHRETLSEPHARMLSLCVSEMGDGETCVAAASTNGVQLWNVKNRGK